MKEIKFRAWCEDETVMYFVEKLPLSGKDTIGTVVPFKHSNEEVTDEIDFASGQGYTALKLMQYIGRKDKNGKEMYDKDIIKIEMYDDEYEYFVIRWNDDYCGYVLYYDADGYEEFNSWLDTSTFEIVGNTFENYELLQDKK